MTQPEKINVKKEPLLRLVRREDISFGKSMLVRAVAILAAALVCGMFIKSISGYGILETYKYMFEGAFRNSITINTLCKETCLLLLIAIALAPAFKMRFWNIGAQGQLLVGGLAAAYFLFYYGNKMPSALLIPIMIAVAVIAGGIWAMIPAFFKVKYKTNETLFTLMMNYIAIQLVACFADIWKGQKSALGIIDRKAGNVGALLGNSYGWIYVVTILFMILMYIYMNKTKQGYEITVVGEAISTARYAGINEAKVIIRTVFISGALCGLVGFIYVSNLSHTISTTTGGSFGFTAIIVAWLAKFNPYFMLLISLLISFISSGSNEISNKNVDLNASVADINIGIFLFFILGCEFFLRFRIIWGDRLKPHVYKHGKRVDITPGVKENKEGGESK